MGLVAAEKGFRVTAIDLEATEFTYVHPNFRFLKGDLFHLSLPKNHFSLVISCSAVEHVGLVGRYGIIEERPDGDLEAMRLLLELLKAGGLVLLTIPCGQDALFLPFHRVYGERRLPRLLNNFIVDHEEYWVKNVENRWIPCSKAEALSFKALSWKVYKLAEVPLRNVYALGCFVLRAP
jgi:SAM-dependent methyltransferase